MIFSFDDSVKAVAKLKVVGVGGAGGNAINRMVISGLAGVEFIAVNTDAMELEHNFAAIKIQIGTKLTGGLGVGANPSVGNMSIQEDRERVRTQLEGADMVIIAAGMGGGTGTGAAPVVAEIAREMGILTVAVVTKPFLWEGPVRDKNATGGLEALRKNVDTVIVVPNQKLLSLVPKSTPLREAFKMADDILSSAIRSISEIILKHGDIQVDFADVRTIMSQGGDAVMGTGRASGENRATIAADRAIHSPLLDNASITGATGVLVNITGGDDLSLMEVNDAMNFIYEVKGTDTQANIIFGTVIDPSLSGEIIVTIIATGFDLHSREKPARGIAALSYPSAPMSPALPTPTVAPIPSSTDFEVDYETPAFLRNQADEDNPPYIGNVPLRYVTKSKIREFRNSDEEPEELAVLELKIGKDATPDEIKGIVDALSFLFGEYSQSTTKIRGTPDIYERFRKAKHTAINPKLSFHSNYRNRITRIANEIIEPNRQAVDQENPVDKGI